MPHIRASPKLESYYNSEQVDIQMYMYQGVGKMHEYLIMKQMSDIVRCFSEKGWCDCMVSYKEYDPSMTVHVHVYYEASSFF